MPYPATPKTWVAGDVLTAAQLNAELRDALLGAFPLGPPDTAWTAFTPTLVQSVTVTKTVTYARYQRIGRTIFAQVDLLVTGAGTAANGVVVGLPVPSVAFAGLEVGTALIYDASANLTYRAIAELSTSPAGVLMRGANSTVNGFLGTDAFAAGLGAGDIVRYGINYESAT